MRQTLDYLGTPYDVHIATAEPGSLTPDDLSSGCRANYHGVILVTADVGYVDDGGQWREGLTASEFQALEAYEAQYNIRQVTWYTFPTPERGFETGVGVSTDTPLPVSLTPPGREVFAYINPSAPLAIQGAYTYLARASDPTNVPLLVDAGNHALAAIRTYPDGRQNLALTFDGNPYLLHSVLFGYGVINWVTRGLFVGERHIYASPQLDDLFLGNELWLPTTPCGTQPNDDDDGPRISGADLQAAADWQSQRNQHPATAQLKLTFAFNGYGTTSGAYDNDTLTPKAKALQGYFYFVNHTFEHPVLDDLSYDRVWDEVTHNNRIAASMGFARFSIVNLVTPEISGLTNPAAMQAIADAGVRYVVSDTSRPGYDNPFPNNGIVHPMQPSILMIPRRANNLFYNAATPDGWAAEYNCLYRDYWKRDLSYDDILGVESAELVMHLLKGENDPWMFHQINLLPYTPGRSLLSDLLDRTFDEYERYFTLPILSPSMDVLGASIARRMAYLGAHVGATIQPGSGVVIAAGDDATVPVTGLDIPGAEAYGGQKLAHLEVAANSSVSISNPDIWPAAGTSPGTLPASWGHGDIGAVGVAGSASYDATAGTFTVDGAGADVWGTADALHYAYLPLEGDGRIIARVVSAENTAAWMKAGVMLRGSLDAGAAQAFMLVSAGKGLAYQRRPSAGGTSVSTAGPMAAAPRWVRLDRSGTRVTAYQSADGSSWSLVGADTIALPATAYVGLAVSSHLTTRTGRALFDHVEITRVDAPPPPPPPADGLPDGWTSNDIGAVGAAGSAAYEAASGTFTIRGGGADVWGTADALHFAHAALSGDGRIVARVASVQNVNAWTKAGVMMRESNASGSAHGFMLVSPGKGLAYQRRPATGGTSVSTAGPLATAPYWVRLDRTGSSVSAYRSADGVAWSLVASETIAMGAAIEVGLGVSSHVAGTLATATFDNVTITAAGDPPPPPPPPPSTALPGGWSTADIGAVGVAGSAAFDSGTATFTVKGGGADVWGTADAFRFAYRTMTGDGVIVARVASVQNTAAWAKAGVMMRETLDAGSAHAFMIVSPGKGAAFQRRPTAGGTSLNTAGPLVTAPYWVKLARAGSTFTSYASADGAAWTLVGSQSIAMAPTIYVGVAENGHTTTATGTATFTNVSVP